MLLKGFLISLTSSYSMRAPTGKPPGGPTKGGLVRFFWGQRSRVLREVLLLLLVFGVQLSIHCVLRLSWLQKSSWHVWKCVFVLKALKPAPRTPELWGEPAVALLWRRSARSPNTHICDQSPEVATGYDQCLQYSLPRMSSSYVDMRWDKQGLAALWKLDCGTNISLSMWCQEMDAILIIALA